MREVDIYTDGSCDRSGGISGWGCVIRCDKKETEVWGGCLEKSSSRVEIIAAIKALKTLKEYTIVNLYSDYKLISEFSEKIGEWKAAGWRGASGSIIKDADLWIKLYDESARHEVRWNWVKGHNGDLDNNRADKLARLGSRLFTEHGSLFDKVVMSKEKSIKKPEMIFKKEDRVMVYSGLINHENSGNISWGSFVKTKEKDIHSWGNISGESNERVEIMTIIRSIKEISDSSTISIYTENDDILSLGREALEWTSIKDLEKSAMENIDLWENFYKQSLSKNIMWHKARREAFPKGCLKSIDIAKRAKEKSDTHKNICSDSVMSLTIFKISNN